MICAECGHPDGWHNVACIYAAPFTLGMGTVQREDDDVSDCAAEGLGASRVLDLPQPEMTR